MRQSEHRRSGIICGLARTRRADLRAPLEPPALIAEQVVAALPALGFGRLADAFQDLAEVQGARAQELVRPGGIGGAEEWDSVRDQRENERADGPA